MNRRSFLCGVALAPLAATAAPIPIAEAETIAAFDGGTFVMPWRDARQLDQHSFRQMNPARALQEVFELHYPKTPENDAVFDDWAAYCDQIIEVDEMDKAHV